MKTKLFTLFAGVELSASCTARVALTTNFWPESSGPGRRRLGKVRGCMTKLNLCSMAIMVGLALPHSSSATVYLTDDFSTYASGNLVGQQGWNQVGSISTLPIQVSGGRVAIPGLAGGSGDNQDAYKSLSTLVTAPSIANTTNKVFYGMTITVTSTAGDSYFIAMVETNSGNNGNGFADFRLTASGNASTYSFGARVNGQTGYPYFYGAGLAYNTTHTVIVEGDMINGNSNDIVEVYVDPTSSDVTAQTPYVAAGYSSGEVADPGTIGFAKYSQFTIPGNGQDGVLIGRLAVADNFADVFNSLRVNIQIASIMQSGNDIVLKWMTPGGTTNQLQVTSGAGGGYSTNGFTNLGPQMIIPGTGVVTTNYTDTGAATNKPARYYRVRLVP